jgi:hypothetical protein
MLLVLMSTVSSLKVESSVILCHNFHEIITLSKFVSKPLLSYLLRGCIRTDPLHVSSYPRLGRMSPGLRPTGRVT